MGTIYLIPSTNSKLSNILRGPRHQGMVMQKFLHPIRLDSVISGTAKLLKRHLLERELDGTRNIVVASSESS